LIDDYLNLGVGAGLQGRPGYKHGRQLAAHRHVLFLRGEGVVVGVGVPGQDAEPARVGGLILGRSDVRGWMSRNVAASSSASSVLRAEGVVISGGALCWCLLVMLALEPLHAGYCWP